MTAKFVAFTLMFPVWAFATPLTVDQLVVFGDSLSDNGNAAIVLGGTLPGNYAPNAFTDGPATNPSTAGPFGLWIDQFAAKTGLADPLPVLANPLNTNYAVASAQTDTVNPQDVGNQVALFLGLHSGSAPSDALYTVWAGANDLYNGTATGVTAANNLYADILALSGSGATHFLWLNLPQLGDTPLGSANAAVLNAQSTAFNTQWAADIALLEVAGIDVTGVDVNSLFSEIMANPESFGFTNVTSPAQGISGNPNNFLFWDTEHPTTAGDALIAGRAYSDLIAAPEPGSFALLLGGLLGICLLRRRATR